MNEVTQPAVAPDKPRSPIWIRRAWGFDIDPDVFNMIKEWDDPPTLMQLFRVYDEITVMRGNDRVVSHRVYDEIKTHLERAMKEATITYRELGNKALWRDQDF